MMPNEPLQHEQTSCSVFTAKTTPCKTLPQAAYSVNTKNSLVIVLILVFMLVSGPDQQHNCSRAFQYPGHLLVIRDCPGDSRTVGVYVRLPENCQISSLIWASCQCYILRYQIQQKGNCFFLEIQHKYSIILKPRPSFRGKYSTFNTAAHTFCFHLQHILCVMTFKQNLFSKEECRKIQI